MNNKSTILLMIAIFMLLVLSGILFFQGRNSRKELDKEKNAGLALVESNDKIKRELAALQFDFNKNSSRITEIINEKENIINENNAKIKRLISENTSGNRAKQQIKDFELQNEKLRTEISGLREQLTDLTSRTSDQSDRIADLEQENKRIKEHNNLLRSMISNNIKITATKGRKSKLTVAAAKTNLISAYVDVPEAISNNISFAITYPDGTIVSSKDVSTTLINVSEPSVDKIAGISASGYSESLKTVELRYTPTSRLKRGLYKVSIFNDGNYITGVYIGLK